MSTSWFGWIWQRRQWHRVTGPHDSLAACSRELEVVGKARGVPGKHQVMTGGAAPTFRPVGKRGKERSSAEATLPLATGEQPADEQPKDAGSYLGGM